MDKSMIKKVLYYMLFPEETDQIMHYYTIYKLDQGIGELLIII